MEGIFGVRRVDALLDVVCQTIEIPQCTLTADFLGELLHFFLAFCDPQFGFQFPDFAFRLLNVGQQFFGHLAHVFRIDLCLGIGGFGILFFGL